MVLAGDHRHGGGDRAKGKKEGDDAVSLTPTRIGTEETSDEVLAAAELRVDVDDRVPAVSGLGEGVVEVGVDATKLTALTTASEGSRSTVKSGCSRATAAA